MAVRRKCRAASCSPMKSCSKCGGLKPLRDFRRDRTKADGLHAACKACKRVTDAAQKLRRRYGLTATQWNDMHRRQGGACYICRKTPETTLEVDHCHRTGKVRGL